jgi:threonine dehydrogenase-like Zn-dependent dehydrogenase
LVEPLSVAWHAVSRSPLQDDDTVLIVGAGPIGLAIVQVLKARGIKTIIVVEISAQRREFARTFGASHTLNPKEVDAIVEIRAITGDYRGASIAFECSGVQAGLDTAMAGLRVRGTAVIVSLWEKKPTIDAFVDIVLGEKHVTGAAIYDSGDFNAVIEAIASGRSNPLLLDTRANSSFQGKIKPQPMITSKIPMDLVAEKGFRALINERDKHVKILVDIWA